MTDWLRRHKGAIIFALTLLIVTLLLANAWKHDLVSTEWLAAQKDSLAALSSIVTLFVLVGGAFFSYYRFFRGRTLSLRAELGIAVSVHQTPEDFILHAAILTAKNVGTSTIWHPTPNMRVEIHGPPEVQETRHIRDWWEERSRSSKRETAPVIEPDETVSFFSRQQIPKTAWAVTYIANLRADTGDTWYVATTVSNRDSGDIKRN